MAELNKADIALHYQSEIPFLLGTIQILHNQEGLVDGLGQIIMLEHKIGLVYQSC